MNDLSISNISIRVDADGRFCANDLHRASGKEKRHSASYWLANQQTRELISELQSTGNPVVTLEGRNGGTFVAKELVYAYAMWISPAFHLKVIRAYDAMVSPASPTQAEPNLAAQYKAAVPVATAVVELGAALGWTREQSQAAAIDVIQRKMGVDIGAASGGAGRRSRKPINAPPKPTPSADILSPNEQLEFIARRGPQLFRTQTELSAASGVAQTTIGRMYRFRTLGGDHGSKNVQRVYETIRRQEVLSGNPSGQAFLPFPESLAHLERT